jgi:magnesium chelatase subunit D
LDIFPGPEDFHIRRQVSLCRLARSIAQLNRKTQVTVGDVDEAASIMGLQTTSTQPLGIPDESPHDPTSGQTTPPLNTLRLVADKEFEAESSKDSEFLSSQQWQNVALSPITSSYPEDNVLPQREFADLRYPLTRRSKQHQDTGVVIGTEKTTGLRDLSITDTIFESAKYCQIRRRNKPQLGDSLSITPADLRKHRRSAKPDHMLILLLDHTCLGDIKKHESRISDAIEDALVAHLRWAYFERASVTIIEVGSGNAGNELRAEKVTAATLVDRRIATALEFNPGKATPLAHGLSLAYETLRRSLWQGRSQPQRVRLVVLSDGRGNVPLSASLTGEIAPPVHAAGITDSFEQARKIRHFSQSESLNRVEAYFLTPSSQISFKQNLARKYSAQDLSVRMAREMNAQFSMISPN